DLWSIPLPEAQERKRCRSDEGFAKRLVFFGRFRQPTPFLTVYGERQTAVSENMPTCHSFGRPSQNMALPKCDRVRRTRSRRSQAPSRCLCTLAEIRRMSYGPSGFRSLAARGEPTPL